MSFDPVYTENARILIVGTYPSPKSREEGFYYGHPQNRFWPMLAALLGQPVPRDIAAKKALICENGLALWDTVAQCTVVGASDASIRDVVPNNLAALCEKVPIQRILCNGALAYRLCVQYQHFTQPIEVLQMPSTSPANAAWRMERLQKAWGEALHGFVPTV
jgi:hypoxanthine-DNA glycosylase